ncbi:MAG TPA: hypothetical protein VEL76_16020, partial [Gemmataceae bacterium]|nr:hypothetical protein [Gemmataceae bacterium]
SGVTGGLTMNAVKIETTVQTDGELHLTRLPVRKGERVEAIVLLLDRANGAESPSDDPQERVRQEALRRFQARADASQFCSQGPYPSREELYRRP